MLWNCNDFIAVPVPNLERFRFRFRIQIQIFFCFSTNLAFSMSEAALFPRKLDSVLIFFTLLSHFMSNLDPNPAPGPEPDPKPAQETKP